MMQETVLPITPQVFWLLVALAGIAVATLLVFVAMPRLQDADRPTTKEPLQSRMGLAELDKGLFALFFGFWLLIVLSLLTGFVTLLWEVIAHTAPQETTAIWDWRFTLAKLTALTATLGAVVALPVTIIRLRLTHQQTEIAKEALFNDKINAAATDLAARREVTHMVKHGANEVILTEWQDDLVTRAAAIDRLEGLANERPDAAPRIARQLSIYVRELSREHLPKTPPENGTFDELRTWVYDLTPLRPDMEKAAQALGRLQSIKNAILAPSDIDLSWANLQRFDLRNANFEMAVFTGAYMDGVNLTDSMMRGANLSWADMRGSILAGTQLQAANLQAATMVLTRTLRTNLVGAQLNDADLRGVEFFATKLDETTNLNNVRLLGSSIRYLDEAALKNLRPDFLHLYSDGFTELIDGENRPKHWSDDKLGIEEFLEQWQAWRSTLPPM